MSWKPIVVGVDATPAAAGAVVFAGKLARAVGVECHLVHVAHGTWLTGDGPERAVAYRAAALHAVREEIEAALVAGGVSPAFARQLDVRTGWPPAILDGVVRDVGAELLVLGAKHHNAVGRAFGGSTVHDVVRMLRIPLLVVGNATASVRRVLIAVDTSAAAAPTLKTAQRFADAFDAQVRVVHAIEPLPVLAEVPVQPTYAEFERLQEEQLEDAVWPLISDPATQKTVRHGAADLSIIEEAASWNADLLVVGSHGKGWVDRMLLGSTTERLINHLPVPLLVVPAGKALRRRPDRPAAVGALSATEDIP